MIACSLLSNHKKIICASIRLALQSCAISKEEEGAEIICALLCCVRSRLILFISRKLNEDEAVTIAEDDNEVEEGKVR